MHIPDGFVSPEINIAGYGISAGAMAVAILRSRRGIEEKQVPLLGVSAAFVFAAQMLNFPVFPGVSGHFLGASFAAILLGPFESLFVMATVLLVQCLGFADGGILTLGTNFLNMGVLAGLGGYGFFVLLRKLLKGRAGFLGAAAAASWLSVVLAASACAVELAESGKSPLIAILPLMAFSHAVIGIGEAIITVAMLQILIKVRPDLVRAFRES